MTAHLDDEGQVDWLDELPRRASRYTRNDQLQELFDKFHEENPLVWRLLVRFTFAMMKRGFKHYSVYAVCERIRWETDQANTKGGSTFKMNNNFRPFYARMFAEQFPQHAKFFRTRAQPSKNMPAIDLPELTPADWDGPREK
jgi:hypothetical protein